jgi:uncharacterized protein (TIGR00290 family)
MDFKGKNFIASYSGGKDSTLAIYRAIKSGMNPLELVTTYNTSMAQSWFHKIPDTLLCKVSYEIGIPISLIQTPGEKYTENFENKLREAKGRGAQVCVFGDIDLEEHLEWCTKRCKAVGLDAFFPLWKEERKKLVYEFIDYGFKTMITVVDTKRLPEKFLGRILSRETADEIESYGADICGENGEFHTFAFDGPLFKNPVNFSTGEIARSENYSVLPLK